MSKSKKKKKPASPKRGKKKSVKMKDLPAKNLENREVLGGAALRRPDALNLGL